jgi:hypothetical protein
MGVRHSFTRQVPHQRFPCLALARHGTSGQVMIIFALASLVLVGFVALSVDTGFLMAERRQTQSAADAAALAGAKALFDGKTGHIVSSAQAYGAENADVPAGNVIANWPPDTGEYAGNSEYVQVTITKDVDKFFVGAVYSGDDWGVEASAVAGVELVPANYALVALEEDEEDEPGIKMNGNSGIVILGDEASAMSNTNITGVGTSDFIVTGSIDASTGINQSNGNWTAPKGIRNGQPKFKDPLKWMKAPAGLQHRTVEDDCPNSGGVFVCEPGIYANQDFAIKNDTYSFKSGKYYFQNTDVSMGNNGVMNGTDVLLYFDMNSWFDPNHGAVNVSADPDGWGDSNLQDGVVFWYSACDEVEFKANGVFTFTGIFYAPCGKMYMHGHPSQETIHGQIFVGRLDVRGTSDLKIIYDGWVDTERPQVFLVN